jgi:hypothetical protein
MPQKPNEWEATPKSGPTPEEDREQEMSEDAEEFDEDDEDLDEDSEDADEEENLDEE